MAIGVGPKTKIFAALAAIAALGVAAFAAILLFPILPGPIVAAVDDAGQGLAALIAAVACGWAARRAAGRIRLAWSLLAISAGLWCWGQAVWTYSADVLGVTPPYPGLPDAGFFASIPFAFAGVRAFWDVPRSSSSLWRVSLDGLIIALALLFSAWIFGLRFVWHDNDVWPERLLDLGYPVADILVGTVVVLAIRRVAQRPRARMLLLLGGVAATPMAGSAFAYLTAGGVDPSQVTVLDAAWVAGYLMIAFAAAWPRRPAVVSADTALVDLWQLALPWIAILLAGFSALFMALSGQDFDRFLIGLTGVGACLLAVNIVLTNRDLLRMLVKSQASEATLAEVIDRAPAGVVRFAADMRIIDVNPRFLALFKTGERQRGMQITSYFAEAVRGGFEATVRDLEAGDDAVEGDSEAVRPDGSKIWVHWAATAVPDPEGRIQYFVAMFEDTTARHAAEAAAASSLELLERLNTLKTEFLQNVSHEFKTALISIQGFSEFMRDTDELNLTDARSFAADINRDAERLDRMVTEMIALDRVESGRGAMRIEPVDLNQVIEQRVASARLEVDGNAIKTVLSAELEPVAGDRERLGDVMRALLHNAIKRSPDGGTITVTTDTGPAGVEVSVADEGVGATSEFDNRLFGIDDVYANSPIRKIVGTGLGLGIARQVVEMHGGRLWVTGGGTECHFSLPVLWKQREAAASLAEAGRVA